MIPTLMNPLGIPPYKRLQYLESTGTQYIDTGVKPDLAGGDSIEIRFYGATTTGDPKSVFGSRDVTGGIVTDALYLYGSNITFGDSAGYTSVSFNPRNDHTLAVNDEDITDNGSTIAQTPKRVTCNYPIFIFGMSNRGNILTSSIYPGMRLYDWKYYRAGTLAQHLIPVLDKSGVPCLIDTVTRTFKYNAGTGAFDYA